MENRYQVAKACVEHKALKSFETNLMNASGRWDLEGFKLKLAGALGKREASGARMAD